MDRPGLTHSTPLRITVEDGRAAQLGPGDVSVRVFDRNGTEVRWYAPKPGMEHGPHDRDELYVIVSGTALFLRSEETTCFGDDPALPIAGEQSVTVKPGDVLYVPAGTDHHFEAMSPDFGCWAVFTGPEGGGPP